MEPNFAKEIAHPKAVVQVAGLERHFPNKPPSAHPNLGPDDLKALIDGKDPVVETIHYQKKRAKDGWNFNVYMKQGIAITKIIWPHKRDKS